VKKTIQIVLVIFVIYFLLTNPTGAATLVEQIFGWIIEAMSALAAFFQSLLY
jgi:hypothetical protein